MSAPADAWIVADPTVCPVCGRDACEDHLPAAPATQDKARASLVFSRAADIIHLPRPQELIEGMLWADGLTAVISESGTGKTFVSMGMGASVSDGVNFCGRRVEHGSVAFFSFEGDALGTRCRALMDVGGSRLEHFYIVRAHDPLSPQISRDGETRSIGERAATDALETLRDELAASRRPPIRLIVIDTVRASLAGSEDSSEHVAAYLRAVRRLMATVPGAGVILSHHAGWQDGDQQRKRERGSSAWRGNCDATLYLEAGDYDQARGETRLTLRALKVRDGERPAPLHLIRRRVELLEMDRHGEPVTSCVIELDRRSPGDREAETAAAKVREARETDLKTLRTIADRPDFATSQDRLRLLLGTRKADVSDSLSRLLQLGWVLPGARNQPYTVTPAGRVILSDGAS